MAQPGQRAEQHAGRGAEQRPGKRGEPRPAQRLADSAGSYVDRAASVAAKAATAIGTALPDAASPAAVNGATS